jgi:prolyl oligopeptidase
MRWVTAAMQWASDGHGDVLLRVDKNAGHRGGGTVGKRIEEWTDLYAFLFDRLGMPR